MSISDEVSRRLPAILHCLMTLLSVPYVLLAVFFVFVGRVASKRGMWEILDTFLNSINWAMTWGCLALGITIITICGLEFIEPLRWWGSLMLAALMAVTLGILLFYPSSFPTLGQWLFLAPAILIFAICCWRLLR